MKFNAIPCWLILFVVVVNTSLAQTDSTRALQEIQKFQQELNDQYRGDKSPLTPEDKKHFVAHPFFPIDLAYRVAAKLIRVEDSPYFKMKTTTSRLPRYRVFGILEFELKGKHFRLPVYQSQDLMKTKEYRDHLFFPFSDDTNGDTTYGGGRYISLSIPPGDELILDFNQAYNPYCAYNHTYSCPIVPSENNMDEEIKAGVMYQGTEH